MAQSNEKSGVSFEGKKKLEELNSLREEVIWKIEDERREPFNRLYTLIEDWHNELPDLREIFQREDIESLLTIAVYYTDQRIWSSSQGERFIDFIIGTGYRDEPDLDKDGKPCVLRTTPVHHAAALSVANRPIVILVRKLFNIYDRYDVDYVDESGFTHLYAACVSDCYQMVEKFLQHGQNPNVLWQQTGSSPLNWALENHRMRMIDLLIRNRVDPNFTNEDGGTPLHVICMRPYDDGLATFFFKNYDDLNQMVQVDAQDKLGRTPLHRAMDHGNKRVVKLLLRRGASPNLADAEGITPLHFICKGDFCMPHSPEKITEMTTALFEFSDEKHRPLQVNARDKFGNTPLHLALRRGNKDATELLLKNDANPNLANEDGFTALHVISKERRDDHELAMMLFQLSNEKYRPLEVNARDRLGDTPLHLAVRRGNKETAEVLLKNEANPNLTNEEELTALHVISKECNDHGHELVATLFQLSDKKYRPLQIDAQERWGNTALHLAVRGDFRHLTEALLTNGANPNLANHVGLTPLHFVAWRNKNDDLARMFFRTAEENKWRVRIDAQDAKGRTPLHLALCSNQKSTMELLLSKGANPNLATVNGSTALHITCMSLRADDLASVFFASCDDNRLWVRINARDKEGYTPLHLALRWGKKQAAELLLRRGANPNLPNNDGSTPLHTCIKSNDEDLLEKFFAISDELNQSVEVDAKDETGRTPLQWAVANIKPNIVNVLLNHGADLSSFVFPTLTYFGENYRSRFYGTFDHYPLRLAASALAIVENLEDKDYEIKREDARTIMTFFAEHELFEKSADFEKRWYDDEEFASQAKAITVRRGLSLYDLTRLRPDEATRQLTFTDYYDFAYANEIWDLPQGSRRSCAVYLCEIISRRFFRSWGTISLLELTRYELPLLCCEIAARELKNKDLCSLCLAIEQPPISRWRHVRLFAAVFCPLLITLTFFLFKYK